ncbi:nicotinate-nucleotide adenylyltransferase [Aquabacterium sp. NJ1]|uniref:nicotinate-nucleotide adenylyltransferase n=1 Tax=Aquabacterium sp. NJ1 TaxID=1538295 RepID=UPI001F17D3A4|nr:nicotinate-nucleotide adenylyltransferase [Aquabacterium sp. NJ1]
MTSSPPLPEAAARRRVGLMGGSFDPVHRAHVELAETALRHLQLDEVRWIPVGQPWQKARQLAAPGHRLAMVQAATAHEPRFVVDPIELNRDGPSYTRDTVRMLQSTAAEPTDWFLIIGQDQYANFPTWQGWHELLQALTLAVACRGHDLPAAPKALAGLPHRVVELPLPPLNVSSTDIRARLARGEDPLTLAPELVSAPVARYIATHQLYAPGGAPR